VFLSSFLFFFLSTCVSFLIFFFRGNLCLFPFEATILLCVLMISQARSTLGEREYNGHAPLRRAASSTSVDYPMSTDDDYQALMLAEFGPLMPVLTQEEVLAAMVADETEVHAPLLPEDDESQAMIPDDNKEDRNKRKSPPPPSAEDSIDEPSPRPSKRAKVPSPRAMNKMMATLILERSHTAPELSESALWCQCNELPPGSRRCALHQYAPFWRWMPEHDQVPPVGSDDGITVPKTQTDSNRIVAKYIRWRRTVLMPSLFYVEHAQLKMKL
jgi:hypothetical protein